MIRHTTADLPIIDKGPVSDISLSVILTLATPSSPASTLPKSPTCLKKEETRSHENVKNFNILDRMYIA